MDPLDLQRSHGVAADRLIVDLLGVGERDARVDLEWDLGAVVLDGAARELGAQHLLGRHPDLARNELDQRIRQTIRYEDYKQFGAETKITFGDEAKDDAKPGETKAPATAPLIAPPPKKP